MDIYIYLPLWEMESSLRDHQQDEASHSKFCCRKNKGWWEGKWISVTVHWGSEGLSIPGTRDKRWKSNTHLKNGSKTLLIIPKRQVPCATYKLERHLWERTLNGRVNFKHFKVQGVLMNTKKLFSLSEPTEKRLEHCSSKLELTNTVQEHWESFRHIYFM